MEKIAALEEFGRRLGFRVEGYYGSEGIMPPTSGHQLIVATIEKVTYKFVVIIDIFECCAGK